MAFVYGPGGPEDQVYSVAREADRRLHETLGLCVIGLVVLRMLWRMVDRRPAPQPIVRWMHLGSRAVQGLLYLLLLAVPITAIAGAWLEGHPLTLLAGIDLRPLVGESHDLGANFASLHTWLGDAILWLAGLHALAGLSHHYILRDGVLVSMLPGRVAPPKAKSD